jgi:hypothetical protein
MQGPFDELRLTHTLLNRRRVAVLEFHVDKPSSSSTTTAPQTRVVMYRQLCNNSADDDATTSNNNTARASSQPVHVSANLADTINPHIFSSTTKTNKENRPHNTAGRKARVRVRGGPHTANGTRPLTVVDVGVAADADEKTLASFVATVAAVANVDIAANALPASSW